MEGVDIPIFQAQPTECWPARNEVSTKKLKTIGINVHSIEIIVCLPIFHLVFQVLQLSAVQYQKRIMVEMKFLFGLPGPPTECCPVSEENHG